MDNEILENLIQNEVLENLIQGVDYNNDFIEERFESGFNKLLDYDVNNFVEIAGDSGDSDIEEDQEEDVSSANVSVLKQRVQDYSEKIFCVTQSYVVIHTVVDNVKNIICYFCYSLQQHYKQGGSYTHVSTHIKRKLKNSVRDLHCQLCCRSLYQLVLPQVCLLCNNRSKSVEADPTTKIPIVPV